MSDRARFILLTQCLQNDFFFNPECRLALPERVARLLLLPKSADPTRNGHGKAPTDGPLGVFLEAAIGRRFGGDKKGGDLLHVVNIRDWHTPGDAYDSERRSFGCHCEKGTWGAAYLSGLEQYLDPHGSGLDEEARYFESGNVRIYHVHSDSVFDFRPRADPRREGAGKFRSSELEDLLDILVQGTDDDIATMRGHLLGAGGFEPIHRLAREIDAKEPSPGGARVYVAVIGVYTDIKVQTLLVGLRTQYSLTNLAVSDTLTASHTLERHLSGLDYAAKVLGVEVVHGVNNLVRFLGGPPAVDSEAKLVSTPSFSRYQSFFQDKQNVLAYQDEKLRDYLALTERRSVDVYERIKWANSFLIFFGSVFLVVTLVMAVLSAVSDEVDWKPAIVTGGIGLLQLISAFYSRPIRELQQNLSNLAAFKMILESHSLKTAFARFHLTTPQALRELRTEQDAVEAQRQVNALLEQVGAISTFDAVDFGALSRLAVLSGDGNEAREAAAAVAAADAP